MTLVQLADMLSDILGIDEVYAGNIDGNLDKCIGVYSKNSGKVDVALGGASNTKTREMNVSVLVHYTDNRLNGVQTSEAYDKAAEIAGALLSVRNFELADGTVRFMIPDKPQSAGRDDRGICEYVIQAKIYYD